MQNNVSRIIVDTNLWISFLITRDFEKLDEIIFSKRVILVFSQELLDEFLEVVSRPKFRSFFSPSDIESVLETIHRHADFVPVQTKVNVCRDVKDNFLLSLSVDGKADFLLTGDKDLLELAQFHKTEIITISEFLKKK
jgi:uncharacterized protein